MCTTLSASRWICLLTLAVVMLCSASEVDTAVEISLPCCLNVSARKIMRFQECYEQKPRVGCNRHAFLIINRRGQWCISPNATWLTDKREKEKLDCPPVLSLNGVQEVDVV